MYQNLLHELAAERIADRQREAATRRRSLAAAKGLSVPADGRGAGRAGRRGGLLPGRRAAACENC